MALANDKTSIARRFSHAASRYDSHARLQQRVAQNLSIWARLPNCKVHCAVDIGCGTGELQYLHHQNASTWLNVDIAMGMLKHAKTRFDAAHMLEQAKYGAASPYYLCADAEALPLLNESVDLVCSSMALQWCDSPYSVLSEVYRVLKKGGCASFAVMVSPSFSNLLGAWQQIGRKPRVNAFATTEQWLVAAQHFNWRISSQQQTFYSVHKNVSEALKSIKGVGANTHNLPPHQSVFSKSEFRQLQACFANVASIELDYQVCFINLQK